MGTVVRREVGRPALAVFHYVNVRGGAGHWQPQQRADHGLRHAGLRLHRQHLVPGHGSAWVPICRVLGRLQPPGWNDALHGHLRVKGSGSEGAGLPNVSHINAVAAAAALTGSGSVRHLTTTISNSIALWDDAHQDTPRQVGELYAQAIQHATCQGRGHDNPHLTAAYLLLSVPRTRSNTDADESMAALGAARGATRRYGALWCRRSLLLGDRREPDGRRRRRVLVKRLLDADVASGSAAAKWTAGANGEVMLVCG